MSTLNLNQLSDLRLLTTERLASLLESRVRTESFSEAVGDLVQTTHVEVAEILKNVASRLPSDFSGAVDEAMQVCARLNRALDILFRQNHRHHLRGQSSLNDLVKSSNQALLNLGGTLIEKDLLERQSTVLERIILSHERITHWQSFVQEILEDFNSIFTFNFFFIAFSEEHSISLHVYYMGTYTDEVKLSVRTDLMRQMADKMGVPVDIAWDIHETEVPVRSVDRVEDVRMVTVKVPEYMPKLAGLLGVAFVSDDDIIPQEEAVIRSILSVMVMVIGSSKVLSKTLMELEYYSVHDPLTGLYNRRHFNAMLEYETGRSERHGHKYGIILLDVDDFKDVNDSYGHGTGDDALRQIANILEKRVRKGDLATRIGGDEFAMILSETNREGAASVANNLCAAVREAEFISQDGKTFHLTLSAGIAVFPDDGDKIPDLLAGVDAAMYRAKALGKDGSCSVEQVATQVEATRTNRDFAEQLRQAFREDRIVPFFQPIVDARTGETFAQESLARLIQPGGQTLPAGAFIDAIEKYSLGRDLDKVIISKALRALNSAKSRQSERLFINLSAQEIEGRGILGFAEEMCAELKIPPERIVFEILERDAIGDMTNMRRFLTNLRRKGFAFALDDFGSGYNSFHYLRELHFDFVKIDGSFVRNILHSKIDRALVQNLSNLCRDIGICTVAEFVESPEILECLQQMSIDYVQGYHIGHARPAE